jgi:hypothetical protein
MARLFDTSVLFWHSNAIKWIANLTKNTRELKTPKALNSKTLSNQNPDGISTQNLHFDKNSRTTQQKT